MIFALDYAKEEFSLKWILSKLLKNDNPVCKHKRLIFLGKQELLGKDDCLALFNCLDCRTTISMELKKKARSGSKKAAKPTLK